jgi:putative photosynthetic complex assembly protein
MSGARADTPRYIRGVPHPLPEGESLLWEGAPDARAVATHVFHWRPLVGYFGVVLLLWMVAAEAPVGSPAFRAGLLPRLALAVVAVAVAVGTAAAVARTTWYAITTHRIVLRIGMVLPMTINLPFTLLQSADVGVFRDGTGQLRLVLARPHRLAYIALWPHCCVASPIPARWGRSWHAPWPRAPRRAQCRWPRGHRRPRARAPLRSRNRPAPDMSASIRFEPEPGAREGDPGITVPTPALVMAAMLLVTVLALAVAARFFNTGAFREAPAAVAVERALHFADAPNGGIMVTDGSTGALAASLPPGTNGFLRGALRTLSRARRMAGLGAEAPFRLVRYVDGRLVLLDPATNQKVTISSFGPTQVAAFDQLLPPAAVALPR